MKILLLSLFSIGLLAEPCLQQGSISTVSASAGIDNTSTLCSNWTLIIQTIGPIASYSAALQGDFGSGFVNMTAATGTNPCTIVTRCTVTYVGVAPNTVRVNVTALTSVPAGGSLAYGISGSPPIEPTSGSILINGQSCALGGTCTISTAPTGAAGGDLSGTYPNPGVAKVNGNTPGGTCGAGQFVSSVNSSAVPSCGTPTGTVSAAAPYITISGVKYVGATLFPYTAPFTNGSNLDAQTITATSNTNGDVSYVYAATGTTNAWYSTSATTSIEAEFYANAITNNTTAAAVIGIWVCDSTNNKVYSLESGSNNGGSAMNWGVTSWTLAGCNAGTPSAGASLTNDAKVTNGIAHPRIIKSGGNILLQISLNGGSSFQTLLTQAVGTLTKAGVSIRAAGTITIWGDFLSMAVN